MAALVMASGLVAAQVQTASATSQTASATGHNGVCESYELCMWRSIDYTDARDDFYTWEDNYLDRKYAAVCTTCDLNDSVSSLQNRDPGKYVRFYTGAVGTGYRFQRTPYGSGATSAAQNLTIDKDPDGIGFNDRFSSHCFVWSGDQTWC